MLSGFKKIIGMFWPVFVEQVLGTVVGLAATAMVAGISDSAVAGVGLVSNINFVAMNMFIAVSTGATVAAAQRIGSNDVSAARRVSRQSLALVTYVGTAVAVLLLVFEAPLINSLFGSAEDSVLDSARTYMRYSSISMPFLAISSTIGGIMRAVGEVRLPMLGGVVSNVLNIAAGAFCIYALNTGVAGAGIGLLVSRAATAALLLWLLQRGHSPLSRLRLGPRVESDAMKPVLTVAIPAAIDSLIFNGCKLLVQVFMSGMGTDTLAAYAILVNLSSFINLPSGALSTLSISVVGQIYGSGDRRGSRRMSWILTLMGCALNLIAGAVVYLALRPLIGLFSPSGTVYKLVWDCMIMFILFSPPVWSFSFLLPNCLRAMNRARYTMLVSIASMILLRLFGAWFLGVHLGYGLYGVWISMFTDWVGRSVCFVIPVARRELKKGVR